MLETAGDVADYLSGFDPDAKILICTPERKEYKIDTIIDCESDGNEDNTIVMIMCKLQE